ncbi:hypothetical protein [Microbacterium sp.]|uniref:hypothetical protein n=1 Tax=Microbacterium sp. TaxID=51671 RepID=UPI003C796C08
MDDLDFAQPTCPRDGTVLRAEHDGFVCACGYRMPYDDVEVPPEFDGPSIQGG